MPPKTNDWQVLFLGWILFQRELDELIRLRVLLLLLSRELLHVLLDVKQIVDLFLCLGNLCSLQGCLFVCVAMSWFVEVVLAARIRFLLARCHFE